MLPHGQVRRDEEASHLQALESACLDFVLHRLTVSASRELALWRAGAPFPLVSQFRGGALFHAAARNRRRTVTVYACPKPPAGRPPKPGRLYRTNKSDGKRVMICRTRAEWEEQREEVGERAGYRCEKLIRGKYRCDRPAPLHDEEIRARRRRYAAPDSRRPGGAHRAAKDGRRRTAR